MSSLETLRKLEANGKDVYEEASRLLIIVADNILKEPSNLKFRTLLKTNATISKKILQANGGLDCLKYMGFVESSTDLTLPINAPLNRIQAFRDEMFKRKNGIKEVNEPINSPSSSSSKGAIPKATKTTLSEEEIEIQKLEDSFEPAQKVELPPLNFVFNNPFLRQIEQHFHNALVYGNKYLQKKALTHIPVRILQTKAQRRLRILQEELKKEKPRQDIPEIGLQDLILLELLEWFKEDFFTWVDTMPCEKCGGKTIFNKMSFDPDLLLYTNRVEMHKCLTCEAETPFPRYNDLNILMETRKGRCGEWANTFTLFCKTMGWDARIVFDETDHVWTEVYSDSQQRWLHCDSCENACDTPLIYEQGWDKKISYVMAYSEEEVQDVTWRYSSNHKEVIKRRIKCPEDELAKALQTLRSTRQNESNVSQARQRYLKKRCLFELVELMIEPKPSTKDQQGRISGSQAWKLTRGETKKEIKEKTFILNTSTDLYTVRYNTALDCYEELITTNNSKCIRSIKGWNCGVYQASNVFRKEEKDWKQTYLCRTETAKEGSITWHFEVDNERRCIDNIELHFQNKTYEDGQIRVIICGDETCLPLRTESMKSEEFSGSTSIKIQVTLSGGKGDVFWQHAQLFRQALNDTTTHPFSISFTFKNKKTNS